MQLPDLSRTTPPRSCCCTTRRTGAPTSPCERNTASGRSTWADTRARVEELARGLLDLASGAATWSGSSAATGRTGSGPSWPMKRSAPCRSASTRTPWARRSPTCSATPKRAGLRRGRGAGGQGPGDRRRAAAPALDRLQRPARHAQIPGRSAARPPAADRARQPCPGGRFQATVAAGRGADVAMLCTTSGTTSHPKLAMLQHRPLLEHSSAYLRADPREPSDEYVSVLPLPWIVEQVYVATMPLLCRIRVRFRRTRARSCTTCARSGRRISCWRRGCGSSWRPRCTRACWTPTASARRSSISASSAASPRSVPADAPAWPTGCCSGRCATVSASQGCARRRPVAPRSVRTPSASFSPWACRSGSSTVRPRRPARTRFSGRRARLRELGQAVRQHRGADRDP